jgi:NADPH-dependent curcumin reductase CurA
LTTEYQGYTVKTDVSALKVLEYNAGLPLSAYVGVAGMPGMTMVFPVFNYITELILGQTAYVGWKLFSKAKEVV